jgi:hypothetical protein
MVAGFPFAVWIGIGRSLRQSREAISRGFDFVLVPEPLLDDAGYLRWSASASESAG